MVTVVRRVTHIARRFAICGSVVCAARILPAQGLPAVPPDLPAVTKTLLDQVLASLKKRGAAYDAKGPSFLDRCGPGKIAAGDNAKMTSCLAEQGALAKEIHEVEIDEKNYIARVTPWTNTSIVDARGPMSGAYLSNQVMELRNSPEVGQINRGFDAVINHDWKVALAWWKQALFRDPNNEPLRRSVDLAQWMVDRAESRKAGLPSTLSIAMHTGASGNWEKAIEQFKAAKVENPAIAPLADHMIAKYKEKQEAAAYWHCEANKAVAKLVTQLRDDAIAMTLFDMDAEAKKAWTLADTMSVGLEEESVACGGK